ncbi:MAG: hypothetical protein SXG53_20880 [Pseudomonadota bacterium]|nr:hypothetical protein [Pseudomonadota bacterium]
MTTDDRRDPDSLPLFDAADEQRLRADVLRSITELNIQCLELFAAQALEQETPTCLLLSHVAKLIRTQAWPQALHRAATCPYLLVDVGYADVQRCQVERVENPRPFFTVERTGAVTTQVLSYAWHVCQTAAAARVLMGISEPASRLIAGYTLPQIHELAAHHAQWIRPRWLNSFRFWRDLLCAAVSGEHIAFERARLHGLHLLAAESVHSTNRKQTRTTDTHIYTNAPDSGLVAAV